MTRIDSGDPTEPSVDEEGNPNHSKFNIVLGLEEYAEQARHTAIYPGAGESSGIVYCALGLVGESGEIANKIKKVLRDDGGVLTDEKRRAVLEEIGDVLWYVAMLCNELDASLASVGLANLEKLKARQSRGTLGGNGDQR